MAEILISNIDEATLARMTELANERGWSTNEVALRALRYALGLSTEHLSTTDRQDIATMRGVWNQSENLVFREAMDAFRLVESGPTFEAGDKRDK
jgi:hypothetical protein